MPQTPDTAAVKLPAIDAADTSSASMHANSLSERHGPFAGLGVLIGVSVAFGVLCGLMIASDGDARAQQGYSASCACQKNAIKAVSAQLDDGRYGLYLVDTVNNTVAVYEYLAKGRDANTLQLRSTREYSHDLKLKQYNTQPATSEIADLVAQDRTPVTAP